MQELQQASFHVVRQSYRTSEEKREFAANGRNEKNIIQKSFLTRGEHRFAQTFCAFRAVRPQICG